MAIPGFIAPEERTFEDLAPPSPQFLALLRQRLREGGLRFAKVHDDPPPLPLARTGPTSIDEGGHLALGNHWPTPRDLQPPRSPYRSYDLNELLRSWLERKLLSPKPLDQFYFGTDENLTKFDPLLLDPSPVWPLYTAPFGEKKLK